MELPSDWAPQSPHLNVITAVWDHPDGEQDKKQKHSEKSSERPSRSLKNND